MKGALSIPVTITPEGPTVLKGVDGLTTEELRDTGVEEFKFNDTTCTVGILGLGALTSEGETPLDIMDEVGVNMPPRPSLELHISELKGTRTPSEPKG